MGRPKTEKDLLLKIAYLYYEARWKNKVIAEKFNIDKATVSRLIKRAAEEGLVRVTSQSSENKNLELDLFRRFGKEPYGLIDIRVTSSLSEEHKDISKTTHALTAKLLEPEIRENYIVGLTCGRAVFGTIDNLGAIGDRKSGVEFIPLNSYYHWLSDYNIGQISTIDSSALALFALAKYGTNSLEDVQRQNKAYLFPLIRGSYSQDDINKKIIKIIETKANNANLVLCGIGTFSEEKITKSDKLTAVNVNHLINEAGLTYSDIKELGWEGEINLQPFDKDGTPFNLILSKPNKFHKDLILKVKQYYKLFYAIPLEVFQLLSQDPNRKVMAVAYGSKKAEAIYAAIKGNLINILITDELTAKRLLDISQEDT